MGIEWSKISAIYIIIFTYLNKPSFRLGWKFCAVLSLCLKFCATIRKVAGPIPDGVTGFFR
jgi:hypothetical protein